MPNKYYPRSKTAKSASNMIWNGQGDKLVPAAVGVDELVVPVAGAGGVSLTRRAARVCTKNSCGTGGVVTTTVVGVVRPAIVNVSGAIIVVMAVALMGLFVIQGGGITTAAQIMRPTAATGARINETSPHRGRQLYLR